MINISNYTKLNKKIIAYYVAIIVVCIFFIGLTWFNISDDYEFYKNAMPIRGTVERVVQDDKDDNKNVVRVLYDVDKKSYTMTFSISASSTSRYKESDKIDLFYNSKNPDECRRTTRNLLSVILIVIVIAGICIVVSFKLLRYCLDVKMNEQLLKDGNFIISKFESLKTIKNLYGNENSYYIISKFVDNEKEYIFKSKRFYKMIDTLNMNKDIKVYVKKDDYKKYIVDIEEFL